MLLCVLWKLQFLEVACSCYFRVAIYLWPIPDRGLSVGRIHFLHFLSTMEFVLLSSSMLRRAAGLTVVDRSRRFRALFGVSPLVCQKIWELLESSRLPASNPVHLLWALMFLKVYASEHVHACLAGVDEKTLRKWQWKYVRLISSLAQVRDAYLLGILFSHAHALRYVYADLILLSEKWSTHSFMLHVCWCHWLRHPGSQASKHILV